MLDVLGNALERDWDYACEQAKAVADDICEEAKFVADDIAYGADRFASGVCERACYLGELFQDAFSDPMCMGGGPWTELNEQLLAVRDEMVSDVGTFLKDVWDDPYAVGTLDRRNTHFWHRLNRDPKEALWDDFLLPQLTRLARRVEALVRDPKEGGKLAVDLLVLRGIGGAASAARNELIGEARVLFWKAPGKAARSPAGAGLLAPKTLGPKVQQLGDRLKQFLGKDARVITNDAGDPVFLSRDGLRRVRFDINRPAPHLNPHTHLEMKVGGKWIKSGPVYPKDVIPK